MATQTWEVRPTLPLWRECWKRAHGKADRIQLLTPTSAIVWNNASDKKRLGHRVAKRYRNA